MMRDQSQFDAVLFQERNIDPQDLPENDIRRPEQIYIQSLRKHIKVDVYGDCGSLKCGNHHYLPTRENSQRDKSGAIYARILMKKTEYQEL